MPSIEAQTNAELRAQQGVQDCLHQSYITEANCRASLATRVAHTRGALDGIRQRHEAFELTGERLSEATTAVLALQDTPDWIPPLQRLVLRRNWMKSTNARPRRL